MLLAGPAAAVRSDEVSPFARYVRARAADAAGMSDLAAMQYAAALDEAPDNLALALRTYRQAAVAGDRQLALKTARVLDKAGALPPDGRLLILIDNVTAKDWVAARATVARIEQEQAFAFLAPIMRGWIAFGSGEPDPAAQLAQITGSTLSNAYAAEHRALILLAQSKREEALDIVKARTTALDQRIARPGLLIAQSLAAAGDKARALALLQSDMSAARRVRADIEAGKRIQPPKIDPAFGISDLLLAVAIDLNRERVTPLSVTLARLALFASPQNSEALLGAAQLLSLSGRDEASLNLLAQIGPDDPYAEDARSARIRILVARGDKQAALDEVKRLTDAPEADIAEWTLLGDIYSSMDKPAEAAAAYGKALELAGQGSSNESRLWTLWLLRGSALEQSGNWPDGKVALQKAYSLAPDEAVVLNHLGYSKLEHGDDVAGAKALIERANKLKPDDAAITDSLGWAHYLQGDLMGAIPKLEAAVEGDPGGAEINEHLGDAYWSAGRRIEARYAWQAAKVTATGTATDRLSRKIEQGLDASNRAP